MKYKKQVVIICLLTFLFLPFGPSRKSNAEILTLTSGAIIACAGLAVACGFVITNPDMLTDIGERIFDTIKNVDGALETVGDKIKINVTGKILQLVSDYIIKQVPKTDYYKENNVLTSDDILYNNFDIEDFYFGTASFEPKTVSFYTDCSSVTINYKYVGSNYFWRSSSFSLPTIPGRNTITFTLSNPRYGTYAYADLYANDVLVYTVSGRYNLNFSLYEGYDANGTFSISDSICIPYREDNTKDVSVDKPLEYFPSGSGSISVDNNIDVGSFSPSIDNPITSPDDFLGEGDLVVDEDTSVDVPDNSVDVPNTGDSVFDSFGSWLGSLLGSLFAPLVDLLQSILNFLKGLFIPSEWNTFDFSPLYFSFSDKFPFCIPFDLIRMVKEFNAEAKEPIFYVDMSGFNSDKNSRSEVGFTLDLTKFDELITIVRTLTLFSFIFFIALKTRDIIKG